MQHQWFIFGTGNIPALHVQVLGNLVTSSTCLLQNHLVEPIFDMDVGKGHSNVVVVAAFFGSILSYAI